MIRTEKQLLEELCKDDCYDAIVVEGYDGVGKGKVLNILSEYYGVIPYRPDYNLWQKYDHRPQDRWKVSGFFWDVFSHFNQGNNCLSTPMLFDRGVLSGAVYNSDTSIAKDYRGILRDRRVLHILVTCDEDSYNKFAEIRGVDSPDYMKCRIFTNKYLLYINEANVEYLLYENRFDEREAERLAATCEGCGHYSYGWCRHPRKNVRVDKFESRCELSDDKEVQDNVTEMQCV